MPARVISSNDAPDKVMVLIGSGAEANSWEPVMTALNRVGGYGIKSTSEANDVLAHLVQNRRYFALSNEYLRKRTALTTRRGIGRLLPARCGWRWGLRAAGLAEHEPSARGMAESNGLYARVCHAIREELESSESAGIKPIKLRPEFRKVWNTVVVSEGPVCIMTTNWDLSIDAELQRQWKGIGPDAILHLHGDRRTATGFLLPSETTFEPYHDDEEIRLLSKRRGAIMKGLEEARRLVIYGLSLSPLDAELVQVVALGIDSGRVEEIDIVDPDHCSVARRLMMLIPSRRPALIGRKPTELNATTRHQWAR